MDLNSSLFCYLSVYSLKKCVQWGGLVDKELYIEYLFWFFFMLYVW